MPEPIVIAISPSSYRHIVHYLISTIIFPKVSYHFCFAIAFHGLWCLVPCVLSWKVIVFNKQTLQTNQNDWMNEWIKRTKQICAQEKIYTNRMRLVLSVSGFIASASVSSVPKTNHFYVFCQCPMFYCRVNLSFSFGAFGADFRVLHCSA